MRGIRYRAWDKTSNQMAKVTKVTFKDNQYDFVNYRYVNGAGKTIDDAAALDEKGHGTIVLMQYTGLKNHKGTEIYEGDIIHARGHYPGEGWYDTGEHEYNFKDEVKWDKEKLAYTCGGYYLHELNIIKIIGNKYQNPELRKEVESNE